MNPNGWKTLAFSVLFCWIGIPQGLADVVPISISQQISASGGVMACDPLCQLSSNHIHDPGNSFSFADTDTQLPPKYLSRDGSASDSLQDPEENYLRRVSVNASVSQFSTLTPTHFNLVTSVHGQLSGNDTFMYGTVSADSQYSLVFDLTSQSLVHLTGEISGGGLGDYPGSGFGSIDGQIHVTGPGFRFDQTPSLDSQGSFSEWPFDEVFTLSPGKYTLDAVSALNREQSYFLDFTSSAGVSLNAEFTPAIPEPARVSTVLGVLMVVGLFFARRPAILITRLRLAS